AEGEEHPADVSAEEQRQQDENQHVRKTVKDVDQPHHEVIQIPADETGNQAIGTADDKRNQGRTDSHGHRNPSTEENSGQQISSEAVCAHKVRQTRSFQYLFLFESAGAMRRYPGCQKAGRGYGYYKNKAESKQQVARPSRSLVI